MAFSFRITGRITAQVIEAKIQSLFFRLGWKMIRKENGHHYFYSKWLKAGSLSSPQSKGIFFADLSCVNTFLPGFPLHYSVLISSNISFSPVPGCSSDHYFRHVGWWRTQNWGPVRLCSHPSYTLSPAVHSLEEDFTHLWLCFLIWKVEIITVASLTL